MYLYHGTDIKSAEDIIKHGINMNKSHKGYFGKGFYTATDEKIAKSNYADFADEDESGIVLKFQLNSNAKILDLDNPNDFKIYTTVKWQGLKIKDLIHRDDFDKIMTELGFDGLRDEGSFGGIVIYNPNAIHLIEEIKFASENIALQFLADYTNKKIKIANTINDEIKMFQNQLKKDLGLKSLVLFSNGNDLKLDSIIVEKSMQKQGIGTKAMNSIIDFADKNNMKITLTTGQRDPHHGTTSSSRLKKFYKKFGFVENKGRNKDFTISGNMYRNPKPSKIAKLLGMDILKKEAEKYKSGEELLKAGGFSIDTLDRAAFGFSEKDIKELDPKNLNIKWYQDLENVKNEIKKSGLSKEEWAKQINLTKPIDVVFENDKFYVDDGHHRYLAAKILNKKLPVSLKIKQKPIPKIIGTKNYNYDEFHRSFFASSIMEVYRGEFSGNKGGKYWSTNKEWAAQFTQTGRIEEVKTRKIKESDIFSSNPLPYAGDSKEIDKAIERAKQKGFKAVKLDEGTNEPDSIYVFEKSALKIASSIKYPKASNIVDGLKVRDKVPNMNSIGASFSDYEILNGIKELPMSDFGGPESVFYASNDLERSKELAEEIKNSGEINPLIIAIDEEGPYILEGAHRFVALYYLNKKKFPAIVVIDKD